MSKKANLTILMTSYCTLRCKLCATYASTNKNPKHYSCEEMIKGVDRFFDCMGEVELFTLSGGEPLLHPQLLKFIDHCRHYTDKMQKFEIITNGTIVPSNNILEALARTDKVDIMIDDYGPALSHNADTLVEAFNRFGIMHRRRKYYGEDAHLGGWLDISDFSDKKRKNEENHALFQKCMYSNVFGQHYFLIDGSVFMCYVNNKLLADIKEREDERVEILDDNQSNEQIREKLINLRNRSSLSVCAYCNGFCNDGVRHTPAEQF